MSRISDAHDNLRSEWSTIESQWQATRSGWRDGVGDQFEKLFWNEFEENVPQFLRSLDELNDTLERALQALSRH